MDHRMDAFVLVKDLIFEINWSGGSSQSWILKAGEICHYFGHSDTYLFDARDGVVPYFNRKTVEDHPDFFKPFKTGD